MPPRKSKLKRSVDQDKSVFAPAEVLSPQSTIIQHFLPSKHQSPGTNLERTLSSSPHKRPKLRHDSDDILALSAGPPHHHRNIDSMYNFSSENNRQASSIIDLTKSPEKASGKLSSNGRPQPASFTLTKVPRTLVVKNLRKPSGPDPEQYYNDVWGRLDVSLKAIFTNSRLPHSKEVLYKEVMILCQQNNAKRLLDALAERLTDHVDRQILLPLQKTAATASSQTTLLAVATAWDIWMSQLEIARAIFFFLDRSYVLRRNLPSIEAMGVERFTKTIIRDPRLQDQILQGICDFISTKRSLAPVPPDDDDLIKRAVRMIIRQGVYGDILEPRLLSETTNFYSKWARQAVASNKLADYISMCEKAIKREEDHADRWALDPATRKQTEIYLEDILIEGQQDILSNIQQVGELLDKNEAVLLQQLFLLLERRSLGESLKPAFEQYISSHGADIVFDEEREDEMVPRLLTFKQVLYTTWEQAFMKNVILRNALRGAFEAFMNKTKRNNMNWGTDNSKPGEMIAKYVDKVLKSGSKAVKTSSNMRLTDLKTNDPERDISDEDEDLEIGKQLDEVLDLFRFVHGKAVFEAFYKRDLARRLLLGRSASSDAEKSMLTRLKTGNSISFSWGLQADVWFRMWCWLHTQFGTNV